MLSRDYISSEPENLIRQVLSTIEVAQKKVVSAKPYNVHVRDDINIVNISSLDLL